VSLEVHHGGSKAIALLIGDAELTHWSSGETHEYVANQMAEENVGRYYLGKKILLDLECVAADAHECRANNLHLVIDLDTNVTLRISGHKPDPAPSG